MTTDLIPDSVKRGTILGDPNYIARSLEILEKENFSKKIIGNLITWGPDALDMRQREINDKEIKHMMGHFTPSAGPILDDDNMFRDNLPLKKQRANIVCYLTTVMDN